MRTAPFPGPGQHSLTPCWGIHHLVPPLHPELCPSRGSRSCRKRYPRVREILHTVREGHLGINPALGEEVSLFSQTGLCMMALWRPSTNPAPGDPARAANFSQTQGCFCWQATKGSSPATAAQPGQHSEPAWLRKCRDQRAGQAQTQMGRDNHVNGGNDSEPGAVNGTGCMPWVFSWPLPTQSGWGFFPGLRQGFLEAYQGWVCAPDPRGENLLSDVWNIS